MSPAPDYICLCCQDVYDHAQIIGDGFCPDCNGDLTDYSMHMRAEQRREDEAQELANIAYDTHVEMRRREDAMPVPRLRVRQAS